MLKAQEMSLISEWGRDVKSLQGSNMFEKTISVEERMDLTGNIPQSKSESGLLIDFVVILLD